MIEESLNIADWNSMKMYARQEGLAEGLAEGLEKGLKKGILKGRKEGLEEGWKKGRNENAVIAYKNCISRGLSREDAIAISGISEEAACKLDAGEKWP